MHQHRDPRFTGEGGQLSLEEKSTIWRTLSEELENKPVIAAIAAVHHGRDRTRAGSGGERLPRARDPRLHYQGGWNEMRTH